MLLELGNSKRLMKRDIAQFIAAISNDATSVFSWLRLDVTHSSNESKQVLCRKFVFVLQESYLLDNYLIACLTSCQGHANMTTYRYLGSACVVAVKMSPRTTSFYSFIFLVLGVMDCMLFTFDNRVPLLRSA